MFRVPKGSEWVGLKFGGRIMKWVSTSGQGLRSVFSPQVPQAIWEVRPCER